MISVLLAIALAAPNLNAQTVLDQRQVQVLASQIVQFLRKQDPRVLRTVMYHMGWTSSRTQRFRPKPRTRLRPQKPPPLSRQDKLKRKIRRELDEYDRWQLNILLDLAGVPKSARERSK